MRGNQEAYILVKIKDGRQYVCALNRANVKKEKTVQAEKDDRSVNLERDVIWQ